MPGLGSPGGARDADQQGLEFLNFFPTIVLSVTASSAAPAHGHTSVFGRISQYFGAVETNERGALHLHGLLWLQGNMHLSSILKDVQGDDQGSTTGKSQFPAKPKCQQSTTRPGLVYPMTNTPHHSMHFQFQPRAICAFTLLELYFMSQVVCPVKLAYLGLLARRYLPESRFWVFRYRADRSSHFTVHDRYGT